ncbi:MAG: hypothetical protein COA84_07060 [Robiginitomaculum sp.]|nr:MAG: hypothetical protein COA84_07060 [Robiginitomaculum sp.]
MLLRRIAESLKKRDWGTVVLEVLIVIVGILIGLQVDNWNQSRKERATISVYLDRIGLDLDRDIKFFSFLSDEAKNKRLALAKLKQIITSEKPPKESSNAILALLSNSVSLGFEFPEVQTVTFFDLRSSGKLALIENASLRQGLSFYYQESLHRSDRVESRITGYAGAVYGLVDPQAGLVQQGTGMIKTIPRIKEKAFKTGGAVESFLMSARNENFLHLLTAEQNYTVFLISQLKMQMKETGALKQEVAAAIGEKGD